MLEYYAKPINRKSVPSLTADQIIKVLTKYGWKFHHATGSHYMYRKAGFDEIPVPVHNKKTLGDGLRDKIIKSSGIDKEKWLNFRY